MTKRKMLKGGSLRKSQFSKVGVGKGKELKSCPPVITPEMITASYNKILRKRDREERIELLEQLLITSAGFVAKLPQAEQVMFQNIINTVNAEYNRQSSLYGGKKAVERIVRGRDPATTSQQEMDVRAQNLADTVDDIRRNAITIVNEPTPHPAVQTRRLSELIQKIIGWMNNVNPPLTEAEAEPFSRIITLLRERIERNQMFFEDPIEYADAINQGNILSIQNPDDMVGTGVGGARYRYNPATGEYDWVMFKPFDININQRQINEFYQIMNTPFVTEWQYDYVLGRFLEDVNLTDETHLDYVLSVIDNNPARRDRYNEVNHPLIVDTTEPSSEIIGTPLPDLPNGEISQVPTATATAIPEARRPLIPRTGNEGTNPFGFYDEGELIPQQPSGGGSCFSRGQIYPDEGDGNTVTTQESRDGRELDEFFRNLPDFDTDSEATGGGNILDRLLRRPNPQQVYMTPTDEPNPLDELANPEVRARDENIGLTSPDRRYLDNREEADIQWDRYIDPPVATALYSPDETPVMGLPLATVDDNERYINLDFQRTAENEDFSDMTDFANYGESTSTPDSDPIDYLGYSTSDSDSYYDLGNTPRPSGAGRFDGYSQFHDCGSDAYRDFNAIHTR